MAANSLLKFEEPPTLHGFEFCNWPGRWKRLLHPETELRLKKQDQKEHQVLTAKVLMLSEGGGCDVNWTGGRDSF